MILHYAQHRQKRHPLGTPEGKHEPALQSPIEKRAQRGFDVNAELESFLKEVNKHLPVKEPTLFAVGGRGYYENPASDLLRFFLQPDAEHGLGDLFLSTFLECMKENHRQLDTKKGVNVVSQQTTASGNYIDLQITGSGWCLVIENKIYHWDANPFTDYENHAEGVGKSIKLFSILSRDGHGRDKNGAKWVGVSFQNYCGVLRDRMGKTFFASPFSKWHIFAREFILHLENELYDPPMTNYEADWVERNGKQFVAAEKLVQQYREAVRLELEERLNAGYPQKQFAAWQDVQWLRDNGCLLAVRFKSEQWNNKSEIVLFTVGADEKFMIHVYLNRPSEAQQSRVSNAVRAWQPVLGGAWPFWRSPAYDSRKDAIEELRELAPKVNEFIKE